MTPRKQCLSFWTTRSDAHMSSETVVAHIKKAQVQAAWGPRTERREGTWVPPLTNQQFSVDNNYQRVSSMETTNHSLNEGGAPTPKEVHMVLCVWWIGFLFCLFGEMFFFIFLFIYILRVRRRHEVKWGGIWECWGRGILNNIYCIENF